SAFDKFFAECKTQLDKSVLSQWPKSWSDFPPEIVVQQLAWLAQYDADPAIKDKLLPVDLKQWAQGAWPQYYIGAFPYCFRLPEYKEKTWPPAAPARPSVHNVMMEHAEPPLIMGQSPGTHLSGALVSSGNFQHRGLHFCGSCDGVGMIQRVI